MASWIGWKSATHPLFEELVEKATSPLNLPYPESEDIALNLEICDLIRSKTVAPRPAMLALKQRIGSKNGRVQMSAMGLADTCIKNGGDHFLQEVAGKDFTDEMVAVIRAQGTQPQVREMALRLFQQWALAFESRPELSYLPAMYRELKSSSGIQFPPPPATIPSHLLTTATPPTWIDSSGCMRCRTPFTFTNRKHHCRNCGGVFDQACSSKMMPLPALGIMEPVRVCEGCWAKLGGKNQSVSSMEPAPPVPHKRTPRSARDMDADLQRAIALSLAESQPGGASSRPGYVSSQPLLNQSGRRLEGTDEEEDDEQLRMAIEASLAESNAIRPTAPGEIDTEPEYKPLPTFDLSPREAETMLTFTQTIDHAVAFGDHDLRRFPHAHALHDQARMISGKLQRNIEEKATKHQMLAEMNERLMHVVERYNGLLTEQQQYAQRQQEIRRQQYQPQIQAQSQYAPVQYGGYPTTMPPNLPHFAPPYPYAPGQSSQQPVYGYQPPPPQGYHVPQQQQNSPLPAQSQELFNQPSQSSMYPSVQYQQPEQQAEEARYASSPSSPIRINSMYEQSPKPMEQPHLQRSQSVNVAPSSPPTIPQTQAHVYPSSVGVSTSPVAAHPQIPISSSPTKSQAPPQFGSSPQQSYQTFAQPRHLPQEQHQQQQHRQHQQQMMPQNGYASQQYQSQPTGFPSFPDAPSNQFPQQQPVETEQPKEALLIEL